MTRGRLAGRVVLTLALWLAVLPADAARVKPPLRGPISDFWTQVQRDWAEKIPGLREGPGQTYQWVSLVYGSEGEDRILDDLLAREMRTWANFQRKTWVRSMFWSKSYERLDRDGFYGSRALQKNLVVMGAVSTNPMIAEMTEATPFGVGEGTIRIGEREYRGPSLVLAFIRPNPFGDHTYAFVVAATRAEALLELGRLPLGRTDFVLFRGGHPIDAGYLDWADPDGLALGLERDFFPDHDGWDSRTDGGVTVHFNPVEITGARAESFAGDRRSDLPRVATRFGVAEPPPVQEFLYASADEKLRQTGRPGPITVDVAGDSIHRVDRPDRKPASWPEAMVLVWRNWGPTDLTGLLYGVSLLAQPAVEGRTLDAWAARLADRGRLPPMEKLLEDGPDPVGDGALQILGLGSFVSHLADRHGRDALEAYYRAARVNNFRRAFRESFGSSLGRAEGDWRRGLSAVPDIAAATSPPAAPDVEPAEARRAADLLAQGEALFLDREDGAAAVRLREASRLAPELARAHLLLARLAFRGGRDEEAVAEGAEALRLGSTDAEIASWAHVTLGRAHAVQGDLHSARLELSAPELEAGPSEPRVLAGFWMENLGLSPNRAAAARYLAEQAEIDLQHLEWDAAEARALQILSADPGNAAGHHLLARIRLERFGYWYNFITLYNELFPNTEPSDPLQYFYLVQSAERESIKGAFLEAGEYTHLDLDLDTEMLGSADGEPRFPVSRVPRGGGMSDASKQLFQGRAFYLARDYPRAASHLEAALALNLPVGYTRALVLFYLGLSEAALGHDDRARAHLEEARAMKTSKDLTRVIDRALADLE